MDAANPPGADRLSVASVKCSPSGVPWNQFRGLCTLRFEEEKSLRRILVIHLVNQTLVCCSPLSELSGGEGNNVLEIGDWD